MKVFWSLGSGSKLKQDSGFEYTVLCLDPYKGTGAGRVLISTHLREKVELDHGVGERVGIGPQVGDHAKHGPVEGPVDLLEAGLPRVVNIHHWHVTQEPA